MISKVPTVLTALALATMLAVAAAPLEAQQAGTDSDLPDLPLITDADTLDQFLWVARPVIVFADTPDDPRFIKQIELLESRKEDLFRRDVVVLVDTDPAANSDLRRNLRPRGFMLAIVGKDGKVAFRKPSPWDVREITRAIDKMPLRKQEIRDRVGTSTGEG